MESKSDSNVNKFVGRHLSQLKILSKLMEHELDAAKGGRELTLDRGTFENILDTLEIFIEDCEQATGGRGNDRARNDVKPAVARLN